VQAVPAHVAGVPTVVVVVDDGSADETAERAAAAGAVVLSHEENRGGGAALRTGYEHACREGARVVVTLDADGQHLPEELPALVEPVLTGRADLVAGSRILGSAEAAAFARELGISFFNRLVSLLVRQRVTDCSNGYRAVRPQVLAQLELRQDQFHAAEFLIEAITRGVSTIEVPVTVVRRMHGQTKKPRTLRYGFGFARAIVSAWLRAQRRGAPSPRSARTPTPPEPTGAERPSA
jgi:glycosyltransferase involved in cell wall biosynthesis